MAKKEIPHLNANKIYKEILQANLKQLKEQRDRIDQGIHNIEDDLKRLGGQTTT